MNNKPVVTEDQGAEKVPSVAQNISNSNEVKLYIY